MKTRLFLHWLAWDLRRFRWPLLMWAALLAAFTFWLWYLNSEIVSLRPRMAGFGGIHFEVFDAGLLKYNKVFTIVLGIVQAILLLLILNSDPAAGARPFWKTRPPGGTDVAASKLAIALVFFLALPLLCWWTVVKLCGLEPESGRALTPERISWMEFLWKWQAFSIGVLAMGAAASRHAASAVARLLVAAAALIALIAARMAWLVMRDREESGFSKPDIWSSSIRHAFDGMPETWLWLAAGALVFLFARRRTGWRGWRYAHLVLPFAVLTGGAYLAMHRETERFLRDRAAVSAPEEVVRHLRIGEPLLFHGLTDGMGGSDKLTYVLRLHCDGLPDDCVATGAWLRGRLISPDNRVIESTSRHPQTKTSIARPFGPGVRSDAVAVSGFTFRAHELATMSLLDCRAEGTVRLEVFRRHEQMHPVTEGTLIASPAGRFRIEEITSVGFDSGDEPLLSISALNNESREPSWWWLEHRRTQAWVMLDPRTDAPLSGWFVEPLPVRMAVKPLSSNASLAGARFKRDAAAGKSLDWQIGIGWYESLGSMDLPVKVEQVFIPNLHYRRPGTSKPAGADSGEARGPDYTIPAGMLQQLTLPAGASDETVRRTLRYACFLAQQAMDSTIPKLAELLQHITPGQKHLLLALAEKDVLRDENPARDEQLLRKIASLLSPEDVPAIRSNKGLFHHLRYYLAEAKLIPADEAKDPGWPGATDESLLETWERGDANWNSALHEAAKRGLTWVIPGMLELMQFPPISGHRHSAYVIMADVSDCPRSAASANWLEENLPRLKWDANSRRWVLPPKP